MLGKGIYNNAKGCLIARRLIYSSANLYVAGLIKVTHTFLPIKSPVRPHAKEVRNWPKEKDAACVRNETFHRWQMCAMMQSIFHHIHSLGRILFPPRQRFLARPYACASQYDLTEAKHRLSAALCNLASICCRGHVTFNMHPPESYTWNTDRTDNVSAVPFNIYPSDLTPEI